MRLERLGETVSAEALKVCTSEALPRRFRSIISVSKLNKKISWEDLIEGLVAENHELKETRKKLRIGTESEPAASKSNGFSALVCYMCNKTGHKAKFCRNSNKYHDSSNRSNNSQERSSAEV